MEQLNKVLEKRRAIKEKKSRLAAFNKRMSFRGDPTQNMFPNSFDAGESFDFK